MDQIPDANLFAHEVHRRVTLVRERQEEEIALWCVREFIAQFEIEPREFIIVHPPFTISHGSGARIEELLRAKGWYFRVESSTDCFISPGTPAMTKAREANPHRPDLELLAQIPDASDAARAIREKVELPRLKLAERFAAWCVEEFARQFDQTPADYVIVQPPYEVPYTIHETVKKILRDRGWSFSDWSENRFYVAPIRSSG